VGPVLSFINFSFFPFTVMEASENIKFYHISKYLISIYLSKIFIIVRTCTYTVYNLCEILSTSAEIKRAVKGTVSQKSWRDECMGH
jgi:hypothetical protein